MIHFRPDTSFPFLAVARRAGVPYERVLRFSEDARFMQIKELESLRRVSPLWDAVVNAMDAERDRRKAVTS